MHVEHQAELGRVTRGVAVWLSRLFHPFVVSVVVLLWVQLLSGYGVLEAMLWTLLSFAIVILPSLLFILTRVRLGRYGDVDVSVREDRRLLYGMAGFCFVLLLVLLFMLEAPPIVQRTLQAGLLAVLVGAGVNHFINKLSLHALTMAGCSTVLFFVSPPAGTALSLMTLLVGWSRLYLTRHTFREVLWGWVVGTVCVGFWFVVSPVG